MKLKETRYFFIAYLIFVITAIIILTNYSKAEIQIAINKENTPFFDFFFKNITHLGSGVLLGLLILFLFFFNIKNAVISSLSTLFMSLIVGVFKSQIFAERPLTYFHYSFKTDYIFHYVDGVKLHAYNSFPSGHTATAFTFFLLGSLFFANKNKSLQIIFFTLALLVGYSRMYISQHFLIDITVGATIGVFSVYFSSFIINKFFPKLSTNSILKSKTND